MGLFARKTKKKEDLAEVLALLAPRPKEPKPEPDEVIDLREEARREWDEAADLVQYDDDHYAIVSDHRRDSVVPRDIASRQ